MKSLNLLLLSSSAYLLSACATAEPASGMGALFGFGPSLSKSELARAIEKAEAYPLGSKENPVRASRPEGQRAYLSRLRCADLTQPEFSRGGSVGIGPFGGIMDVYIVTCPDSEPAEKAIYMDMYHGGYSEERAVEGYGITGGRREEAQLRTSE